MTEAEKHSFDFGPPINLSTADVVDHRAKGIAILERVKTSAALKAQDPV